MKHFEFWHPRLFEAPYYLYLLAQCALRGMSPKGLAKANYALDHGELGLGSKFATQMAFDQAFFLPTLLLDPQCDVESRQTDALAFVERVGYPVILKPDIGAVGKGVVKISDSSELAREIDHLASPHLCQQFTPLSCEFGVFYARRSGRGSITGINRKHFPEVTGDGVRDIASLARAHPRYTDHWGLFLRYLDTRRVPAQGELVRLSFIGSHTMGCRFTNDTEQVSPELQRAIETICDSQPGFNFGRFDLKAESLEALQAGEFVVIEVNGVASLPTHMFDPQQTLWQAYRIFLQHGRLLAQIASEQRHQEMPLDTYGALLRRARNNHQTLNAIHKRAVSG